MEHFSDYERYIVNGKHFRRQFINKSTGEIISRRQYDKLTHEGLNYEQLSKLRHDVTFRKAVRRYVERMTERGTTSQKITTRDVLTSPEFKKEVREINKRSDYQQLLRLYQKHINIQRQKDAQSKRIVYMSQSEIEDSDEWRNLYDDLTSDDDDIRASAESIFDDYADEAEEDYGETP